VKPRGGGHGLVELLLALALAALLGALGTAWMPQGSPGLTSVQGELRAAVEQAFLLARGRGREVRLALGGHTPACRHPPDLGGVSPLVLPRGVRWGLPDPDMRLPDAMARPERAHLTGAAHPCLTVTPGGTAQAGAWFLTDGRDAVCLRLAGTGTLTLFRWRHRSGAWFRV
jgi:hypothetical protein